MAYVRIRLAIYVTCVTNVNRMAVPIASVLTSIQFYMCNICLVLSP
jgi:hypothetical protein